MSVTGDYRSQISDRLFSLLTEREFCDMELITKDESFFCTRLILAAASPVFCNIIKESWTEYCVKGILKIDIKFLSSKVVERLLKYFYTGEICDTSDNELKQAAEIFGSSDIDATTIEEVHGHFQSRRSGSLIKKLRILKCKELGFENEGDYLIHVRSQEPPKKRSVRGPRGRLNLPLEPPYLCPCENCGKIFETRERLRSHYRHNHGEKKYKCTECPLRFLYPKDLRTHSRTHTGERPFVCETCGKRFGHNSARAQHMLIHAREKNEDNVMIYPCASCKKEFSYRDVETNLLFSENYDESSLVCPNTNCAKKFSAVKSLKKHLRNRVCYIGEPKCVGCNTSFESLLTLRKHIAQVHCIHKNKQRRVKFDQIEIEAKTSEESKEETPEIQMIPEIQCALCGEFFQEQLNYDKHLTEHEQGVDDMVPIETSENVISIDFEEGVEDCVADSVVEMVQDVS